MLIHCFSGRRAIVGGAEFGLKSTGLLHSRPLSRGVGAPVALLTLPSVGRCGAVFPFASWADGTIVKLPTRILLKSLLFVVVILRSSFLKKRLGSFLFSLLARPFSRPSDLKSRSCSSEGFISAGAVCAASSYLAFSIIGGGFGRRLFPSSSSSSSSSLLT